MFTFTNHWRERIGQTATKLNIKRISKIVNGKSDNGDDQPDNHRHGAEGQVFQVNNDPEQVEDMGQSHRHGAEGHAFQVNDRPEGLGEKSDDTP